MSAKTPPIQCYLNQGSNSTHPAVNKEIVVIKLIIYYSYYNVISAVLYLWRLSNTTLDKQSCFYYIPNSDLTATMHPQISLHSGFTR